MLLAGVQLPQTVLRAHWDRPDIQRLLAAARERFGHALCMCRPQPLKLQLRLRSDKVHLAVWPHQHPAHDTECLFFHEPLAAGDPEPPASFAAAPDERGMDDPAATAARPTRTAWWIGPPAAALPTAETVTVQTLALRLWEAASLCRWRAGWSRDWGRARHQLYAAAACFSLDGLPLEQLLFAPRPYRTNAAAAVTAEWGAFATSLRRAPAGAFPVLVAPLRRLRLPDAGGPATVWLRHLRAPVTLRPACWDFLARHCRSAIANSRIEVESPGKLQTQQPPPWDDRPELIGFFLVESRAGGGVQARAAWLLPVHPSTYLPAANGHALRLIDALRAGGHVFDRLPSAAAAGRRSAPDLLLRHVLGPDGRPVARAALEVLAASASAAFLAARQELARRMAGQGVPTWLWTPTRREDGSVPVPALPPRADLPAALAAERLHRIAVATDASYGFGLPTALLPRAGHQPAQARA